MDDAIPFGIARTYREPRIGGPRRDPYVAHTHPLILTLAHTHLRSETPYGAVQVPVPETPEIVT